VTLGAALVGCATSVVAPAPDAGTWRRRDGGTPDASTARDDLPARPDGDVDLPCEAWIGSLYRCSERCGTDCPSTTDACHPPTGLCISWEWGGCSARSACLDADPCLSVAGYADGACVPWTQCAEAVATGVYECRWGDGSVVTGPPPDEGACPGPLPGEASLYDLCGGDCGRCAGGAQCVGPSGERGFGVCIHPERCDPERPPRDCWHRPCECMQLGSPEGWSGGWVTWGGLCSAYRDRYGPDLVRCTPFGGGSR
jgi:hypothetical protein